MTMTQPYWDQSYPPSVLHPEPIALSGVEAGTPGTFLPPTATPPASLAELRADQAIGDEGTAHPTVPWLTGQYVVLGNASHTHAFWAGFGTGGWQSGEAPEPTPPEAEPESTRGARKS